nr:hypothetical protein CFP56_55750 [Quercus suber]
MVLPRRNSGDTLSDEDISRGPNLENSFLDQSISIEDKKVIPAMEDNGVRLQQRLAPSCSLSDEVNCDLNGLEMATHGSSSQPILDWKLIFHEDQNATNSRTVVKPPVQEGIAKRFTNLAGQFLEKPLPFLLVKKSVQGMKGEGGLELGNSAEMISAELAVGNSAELEISESAEDDVGMWESKVLTSL